MNNTARLFLCFVGIVWGACVQADTKSLASRIQAVDKHVSCLSEAQQGDITLSDARFKNPKIQECANKIEIGDNLKPLKLLWEEAKREGSLDKKFIGEFCLLLFLSYESIIAQLHDSPTTRSSWFAIVSLYAQLSALPLPELFEALEACWKQYQEMIKGYKVEGVYSLKKWIKEFWWIIPTSVAFIAAAYARWQKGRTPA